MESNNALVQVVQLPVIEERLHELKARWEQMAADAEAMVCTDETIQAVKTFRTDIGKEFEEIEAVRKHVKKSIMEPYDRFDAVYKDCVTAAYQKAYAVCTEKISAVETEIKRRCEDGLRDYFAELCAVRHLDWLTYERAGIKVDMASAKAKTPKKLREQLAAFVTHVGDSVDRILLLDDAGEIMVEFQNSPTLDAAAAICTVHDRKKRIKEQRAAKEANKAVLERETESVRKVEALAPPVVMTQESTIKVSLVLYPTKAQFEEKIKPIMRQLKEICDVEGIKYE